MSLVLLQFVTISKTSSSSIYSVYFVKLIHILIFSKNSNVLSRVLLENNLLSRLLHPNHAVSDLLLNMLRLASKAKFNVQLKTILSSSQEYQDYLPLLEEKTLQSIPHMLPETVNASSDAIGLFSPISDWIKETNGYKDPLGIDLLKLDGGINIGSFCKKE